MANCNCNDFPISCAPHAPGGECHHHHGCPPHPVCPPPEYKGGTSMYIGARYVPIFADPVEWDNEREYEPLTIVVHNGNMYTSKCYVPKGAPLPESPEIQTKYWVCTADYNYQFADLKQTVLDLSRLVEQFQKDNEHFTELINGWNEKVIQWEKDMTAWGERLDTVESNVADLTASLNAEIARAKAAEQANAAAIAQETADRKQAISELDTAYKAADAAEAQTREAADTALSNRIVANKTDIDAIKAEQVVQNTNISANAKNISDNAAEIAKHAARLTSLESNASDWDDVFPDTTIAQEMQKEENARANADTALNGRIDAQASDIEELRDAVNHKVDQTIYTADQTAQDTKIKTNADAIAAMNTAYKAADAELNASITAETDRATGRENEIETGYKKAVNDLKTEVTGDFVTKTVYNAGQATQDKEIAAVKAASGDISSIIGNWNTDHPGQTISECATSLENETAANAAKADANAANIGDWHTSFPDQTIAQEVTRLNGSIPDVSEFVTKTVYNQGQAAQDTKINDLTGKLANINYLAFLNELYPENIPVPGGSFVPNTLYPAFYNSDSSIASIDIPIVVPAIVSRFNQCWTFVSTFPTSISLLNAEAKVVETKTVTRREILDAADTPRLQIGYATPFIIPTSGVYYFRLGPVGGRFKYNWVKNNVKFAEDV